jgi:hypothetical protein
VKKDKLPNKSQDRHGWQGPQGLGLAWILQNRKRKQRNTAEVAATVEILSAKHLLWLP